LKNGHQKNTKKKSQITIKKSCSVENFPKEAAEILALLGFTGNEPNPTQALTNAIKQLETILEIRKQEEAKQEQLKKNMSVEEQSEQKISAGEQVPKAPKNNRSSSSTDNTAGMPSSSSNNHKMETIGEVTRFFYNSARFVFLFFGPISLKLFGFLTFFCQKRVSVYYKQIVLGDRTWWYG